MNIKGNKHFASMRWWILFGIYILIPASVWGQVTIGSGLKANSGSLLELKEWEATDGDANSTRGFMLPRVKLTKLNQLTDIPGATDPGYEGLMVYNVNDDVCTGSLAGIYVWDGTAWTSIGAQDVTTDVYQVIDARDGEVYFARDFGDAGSWMLENMRYVPKTEDGYIGYEHKAISSSTAKYYIYPEKLENPYVPANHPSPDWESKKRNGLLYNWPGATNGENPSTGNQSQTATGTDPVAVPIRGVCPPDWHIPSDKEFNDLEREIYNHIHLYSSYSESDKDSWSPWLPAWELSSTSPPSGWRPSEPVAGAHGSAMKSACPPGGSITTTGGKSLMPEQGGFNLPLVGYGLSGSVRNYGARAFIWNSSSGDSVNALNRYFRNTNNGINLGFSGRDYLYSVRCKK